MIEETSRKSFSLSAKYKETYKHTVIEKKNPMKISLKRDAYGPKASGTTWLVISPKVCGYTKV